MNNSKQMGEIKITNLFNLKEKVAVVTGGAGWLGAAFTEALLELGAEVYITGRNKERAEKLISRLSQIGYENCVHFVPMEADSEKSIAACFQDIADKTGHIDVLVNNAYSGKATALESISAAEWNETLHLGITSYFLCIKSVIPIMKERGGNIINIASMYGSVSPEFSVYEGTPYSSSPAYGAAKAGIIQFTRYAACSLAKYNIRVNALSPGPFPSPNVLESTDFTKALAEKTPMGRIGTPWELKGPISFLATDASTYVTGQNLMVDGGWTAW